MRVLLVHAPRFVRKRGRLQYVFLNIPPLGLYGIASHLVRGGHDPVILHMGAALMRDPGFRLDSFVREGRYGMVGISMHWHHQVHEALSLASYLKKRMPDLPVVAGGLTASAFHREVMAHSIDVDFLVRGDGEEPLNRLASALEVGGSLDTVPNLCHRKGDRILENPVTFQADAPFMSGLSYADQKLCHRPSDIRQPFEFDAATMSRDEYFSSDLFYLAVGRGCTRNCSYCGGSARAHRELAGRTNVAFRPAQDVVEDLLKLRDYGYRRVYFCFDPPPSSSEYYLDLFGRLADMGGMDMGLEFDAYVPHGRRFYEAMSRAFIPQWSQVAFSPDTADEKTRRRFKGYGYSNRRLEADLQHLRDFKIKRRLYFSVLPGIGRDAAERTAAWMKEMNTRFGARCSAHFIEIEPGSRWHENPARWGLIGARRSFEEFAARHRDVREVGSNPIREVGYESGDLFETGRILVDEPDPG